MYISKCVNQRVTAQASSDADDVNVLRPCVLCRLQTATADIRLMANTNTRVEHSRCEQETTSLYLNLYRSLDFRVQA